MARMLALFPEAYGVARCPRARARSDTRARVGGLLSPKQVVEERRQAEGLVVEVRAWPEPAANSGDVILTSAALAAREKEFRRRLEAHVARHHDVRGRPSAGQAFACT